MKRSSVCWCWTLESDNGGGLFVFDLSGRRSENTWSLGPGLWTSWTSSWSQSCFDLQFCVVDSCHLILCGFFFQCAPPVAQPCAESLQPASALQLLRPVSALHQPLQSTDHRQHQTQATPQIAHTRTSTPCPPSHRRHQVRFQSVQNKKNTKTTEAPFTALCFVRTFIYIVINTWLKLNDFWSRWPPRPPAPLPLLSERPTKCELNLFFFCQDDSLQSVWPSRTWQSLGRGCWWKDTTAVVFSFQLILGQKHPW